MKWGIIPQAEQKNHAQQILRRAVETYHRDWRLLQEPLQNAIDSFIDQETGKAIDFGSNHKPTVSITVWIRSSTTCPLSSRGRVTFL